MNEKYLIKRRDNAKNRIEHLETASTAPTPAEVYKKYGSGRFVIFVVKKGVKGIRKFASFGIDKDGKIVEGTTSPAKKTSKKAELTPAEDKAWTSYFLYYKEQGLSDKGADKKAWEDLQKEFLRLKKYEGATKGILPKTTAVIGAGVRKGGELTKKVVREGIPIAEKGIKTGVEVAKKAPDYIEKITPAVKYKKVLIRSEIIHKGGKNYRKNYYRTIPAMPVTMTGVPSKAKKEKTVEDKKTDNELKECIVSNKDSFADDMLPFLSMLIVSAGTFFGLSVWKNQTQK